MHPEVKSLIEHYHLQPLPIEGTLFASTYRSTQEYEGGKPVGTAMIGMYCDDPYSVSLFHKLKYDEVWHFYAGGSLTVHVLGETSIELSAGNPQAVVPAGRWFGATVAGEYALVGCTVAPGFDFQDFEMGDRAALLREFPGQREIIERLTK